MEGFIINILKILSFFPVGIIAGILGTIVGIASLASYPALLFSGLPPVVANTTNITSQIFIGIGSAFSSVHELRGHIKEWLTYFSLILFGGIGGSLLAAKESSASFSKIVPFFILFAALLILWPKKATALDQKIKQLSTPIKFLMLGAIFLVGIYAGYFGAASGVIMMAILNVISNDSFPVQTAIRNVSLPAANVVAIIIFVFNTQIDWAIVVPLGLGMLVGGSIGPVVVRHVNDKILKVIIGICAIGLAIDLFIQAY